MKAPVAMVHSQLGKGQVHQIVGLLFREEPDIVAQYPDEVSPRYLVGTTKLLGVGITLTKARRMVHNTTGPRMVVAR